MIQDDIFNKLQYIPEAKPIDIYDLIHYFRLRFNGEVAKQSSEEDDFAIDESICLKVLEKIKRGGFSGFSEIDDVDAYIQNLRSEICVKMIKNELDDLEDYHLATQVLERVKSGQEKVYSASEIRKELGLDNNMV